jgi:rhodanese-related sulfurtransferase
MHRSNYREVGWRPLDESGKLASMATTLAHIDRETLRSWIEGGKDFVLVDALSPMSFAMSHLPGAINITPDWIDDRARRRIPDLETPIVVYCADAGCDSSVSVASRLVELGYRNVRHYADGKRDWVGAGLPVEGGRGTA